jgi:hypothetical protein
VSDMHQSAPWKMWWTTMNMMSRTAVSVAP